MVMTFDDISQIFDTEFGRLNFDMMESIALYEESYQDFYAMERKKPTVKPLKEPLLVKLKKFLADIITTFENFIQTTKTQIENTIREKHTAETLRKLHKELTEKKNSGKETVTVTDVWTMKWTYLKGVDELRSLALKISKMNYTTTASLDSDLERFEKTIDGIEKELNAALNRKITVPTQKMIDFVEREITGQSNVMQSLNQAISMYNQMKTDVSAIEKKRDVLGPDVLSKYASSVRRVSINIGSFFKKWAVKFIVTVCLIFG